MRHVKAAFMLLARSSIYRLLLAFLLMGAVQGWLFYQAVTSQLLMGTPSLEVAVDEAKLSLIFGIGAILVFIILAAVGCEFGNKQGYTLKRLPISEKGVFLCQSVYNSFVFFLLWAVELLITYILCRLYISMVDAAYLSNQTILLAYYRSDLLHALLPLADITLWIRNVVLVISFGVTTAAVPYYQRIGTGIYDNERWPSVVPVGGIFFTVRSFFVDSPYALVFALCLFVYAIVLIIIVLRRKEEDAV
ncbi:MAG: hypothetical protein IJX71_02675 [Oscillospiraceae bacterium]|nr:hypothetical protein [Oscillospiraceae bacterium]